MDRKTGLHLGYVVLAVFAVLLLQGLWIGARSSAEVPYSQFRQWLAEGRVREVVVGRERIHGVLEEEGGRRRPFVTVRVDPEVAEELEQYGVVYRGEPDNDVALTVLSWVVPVLLFVGLWALVVRRMAEGFGGGAGFMSVGKSKARVYVETDIRVRLDDVAGVDEAKAELQEIVAFLRDPKGYGRLGARMPKGVLLVGPPGTGKTLLARAVAGEAGVPFFSISGSEFVEMFVGVGAARVRDLFEQARRRAPCIIFIDELDALGRARSVSTGLPGHDEKEQTLNQLLVELDGFDPTSGIVLIGATNRPEILDPALLRAGRFDRQILVDRPDRRGRVEILRVHLKRIRLGPDVDPDALAGLTTGFTGADLANLVNEAAVLATRRGAEHVEMQDFTAAIERIVAGLEKKNRLLNPREREVVAHHEMGHALVAAALAGADPVHKISIVPRGIGALGYTLQQPTEDRYLMSREELEVKMAVLLGGRAAEHLVFGRLSTGAADDLAKATDIARSMVTRYAMVPELGPVAYDTQPQAMLGGVAPVRPRDYSEQTAREIDCAVRRILEAAFDRALDTLRRNRDLLLEGARELLRKETLERDDLEILFARVVRERAAAA